MDQNFQTSFIPKKPIMKEQEISKRPVGLLTILSFLLFFTMILVLAGFYFYKGVLTKNISQMEKDLTLAKNRFEPSKITQLQVLDERLLAANEILGNHIAISPIFKALSDITMKSVRYTKFSYDLGNANDQRITVKLSGQATGYRSVALQSDLFLKNKYLIDPAFSGLSLDEKGNVLFELEFMVDPNFVDYKQTIETNSNVTPSPSLAE